ncbi:MAG: hypothetical protein ABS77_11620 [Phenylobacterium sp. SCN 69-14]|nr:MAG: hypothetical protein ABS77_11620 [Phenylobacterium sp. SCN 69-14]
MRLHYIKSEQPKFVPDPTTLLSDMLPTDARIISIQKRGDAKMLRDRVDVIRIFGFLDHWRNEISAANPVGEA